MFCTVQKNADHLKRAPIEKTWLQIFVLFIFITLITSGTIIYLDIFSIQEFNANFKLIEKEINSHYNYYLLFF